MSYGLGTTPQWCPRPVSNGAARLKSTPRVRSTGADGAVLTEYRNIRILRLEACLERSDPVVVFSKKTEKVSGRNSALFE